MALQRPLVLLFLHHLSPYQGGSMSLLFAWPTPNWGKPQQLVNEKSRKDPPQFTSALCFPGPRPRSFFPPRAVVPARNMLKGHTTVLFFPSEQMALSLPCRLKSCQAGS